MWRATLTLSFMWRATLAYEANRSYGRAEAKISGFEIKIPGSAGINSMFLRFMSERNVHKESLVVE